MFKINIKLFSFFLLFFSFFIIKSDVIANKSTFISNKETLKYKISYGKQNRDGGLLSAGHANFNYTQSINNDNTLILDLNASGKTNRLFSFFFNVKHAYSSHVELSTMKSIEFTMNIQQGKYSNVDSVRFNDSLNTIVTLTDTLFNPSSANDLLSICYVLRNYSHNQLVKLDTLFFNYYYDNAIYQSYIINLGVEKINTKFGKINTLKLSPLLEKGRFFKKESGATLWITADDYHVPLKLEIPILKGSIYVNLKSYDGCDLIFF